MFENKTLGENVEHCGVFLESVTTINAFKNKFEKHIPSMCVPLSESYDSNASFVHSFSVDTCVHNEYQCIFIHCQDLYILDAESVYGQYP